METGIQLCQTCPLLQHPWHRGLDPDSVSREGSLWQHRDAYMHRFLTVNFGPSPIGNYQSGCISHPWSIQPLSLLAVTDAWHHFVLVVTCSHTGSRIPWFGMQPSAAIHCQIETMSLSSGYQDVSSGEALLPAPLS